MSADPTELVADALAGDGDAWRRIVDRYSGLVWAVIRSLAIPEADRPDVFQTVFLRLTENLGRIEPAALPGWLMTVSRRECYAVGRRRQRLPVPTEVIDLSDDGADGPEDRAVTAGDEDRVLQGLRRLSETCRQLLTLLAAPQEFSYQEISDILDMPVGSIGPTRSRCLDKLADTPEVADLDPARRWRSADA